MQLLLWIPKWELQGQAQTRKWLLRSQVAFIPNTDFYAAKKRSTEQSVALTAEYVYSTDTN